MAILKDSDAASGVLIVDVTTVGVGLEPTQSALFNNLIALD